MNHVLRTTSVPWLKITSVLVVAIGLTALTDVAVSHIFSLVWAQGAPEKNPMRQMMRGMMRGAVPPPGMTLEALPEPESSGAKLMARYCTQCHDLPSPRYKTTREWPAVFDRMLGRMNMMSAGGMMGMPSIRTPDPSKVRTLMAYLRRNAMVAATSEQLAKGPSLKRAVFQNQCARCHKLPSPTMHPPELWPSVVMRMQANMQLMGKSQITPRQREAITGFLMAASDKTSK